MPPDENSIGELYFMNENGDPVKIGRFSEMPRCEIGIDPKIDIKNMYDSKFEGTFELTPESAKQMAELQKQFDAEVIENLKKQIEAVDDVILGLKCCEELKICPENCPYYEPVGHQCSNKLHRDAIAIAEAYKRVVESGLRMMKERGV